MPLPEPELLTIDDPEVEIVPSDMQGGFDPATGMPRAEPGPGAPKPKPPVVAKAEPPKPDPEVTSLRARLAEADRERERLAAAGVADKAARDKAEKDAAVNIDYAIKTHGRAVTAEYDRAVSDQNQILSAIETIQQFQGRAEDDMRRALEDDNASPQDRAVKIAKANREIAAAAARLETLEGGKRGVEARVAETKDAYDDTQRRLAAMRDSKPEPKSEPEVKAAEPPPAKPKAPSTADEWIDTVAPAAAKAWLKEHKAFATPGSKEQRQLNAFAADWLIDNPDPTSLDSQTFVDALEAKFFPQATEEAEPVAESEAEPAVEKPAARPSAPAAPVSRTASSAGGKKSGAIQLTPEQYATAPEVITEFADLDPDFQAKFKQWTPTAARYQYERNLQRAKREKPHRFAAS